MTDYGNATNAWLAGKWPAIRARGMQRFVLVRGVAFWGGVVFAAMATTTLIKFGPQHPNFAVMLGVAAGLSAVGGLVWGLLTWTINERIHRSIDTNRRSP